MNTLELKKITFLLTYLPILTFRNLLVKFKSMSGSEFFNENKKCHLAHTVLQKIFTYNVKSNFSQVIYSYNCIQGEQNALIPFMCDVAAFPCVVSTSEMTAIELRYFVNKLWGYRCLFSMPWTFKARTFIVESHFNVFFPSGTRDTCCCMIDLLVQT